LEILDHEDIFEKTIRYWRIKSNILQLTYATKELTKDEKNEALEFAHYIIETPYPNDADVFPSFTYIVSQGNLDTPIA